MNEAPGAPGAGPSWGPGHKQGFGASPSPHTRVWMTLARGSLSEVFYPALDEPCLHELRFIVAAPGSPPIDDAGEATHEVRWIEPGVPAFRVTTTHPEYNLVKEFAPHPMLNAVLVAGTFAPQMPDLALYVQASAHLAPGSTGNQALVLDRDPPLLCLHRPAEGQWVVIAGPFAVGQAGYLASSDLLVDLDDNDGRLSGGWTSAGAGNATVGARLGIPAGSFQLAVGFAATRPDAEEVALQALRHGAAGAREELARAWRRLPDPPPNLLKVAGDGGRLARASVTVLRCLEDKTHAGAFVAAPGAPWGEQVHDGDQVYHLVWPRDLFQAATALLDAGDADPARRALRHLERIQLEDGSWPKNSRLDGTPHWRGVELDQTSFPVLLAWRLGVAGELDHDPYPTLVRQALRHLVSTGPATPLDRWEDASGLSISTLAVAIPALVAAAEFAEDAGDHLAAAHARRVADYWNERIEAWLFLRAFRHYVRVNPDPDRPAERDAVLAVDFLELVRRGLRSAGDPRIEHSLATADAVLRAELPGGPSWRRYAGDAYGEDADGAPWTEATPGIGRPWPLLTGERGQWALAAGEPVAPYVRALEAFAAEELLLPEQVWDAPDIAARGLETGRATGSCRPLGWAHAEYLKLLAALATESRPDAVEPARRRYESGRAGGPPPAVWHPAHDFKRWAAGRSVALQLTAAGAVRWTRDAWTTHADLELIDTGLGLHVAELPVAGLPAGARVEWTSRDEGGWSGANHTLECAPPEAWEG